MICTGYRWIWRHPADIGYMPEPENKSTFPGWCGGFFEVFLYLLEVKGPLTGIEN
jgi:hypothetical protein